MRRELLQVERARGQRTRTKDLANIRSFDALRLDSFAWVGIARDTEDSGGESANATRRGEKKVDTSRDSDSSYVSCFVPRY